MPIGVAQAALGAAIEVPTLGGGTAKLNVPEGTQSGTVLKLKGHGVQALGGRGRGDLHVLVRVVVPKHLTSEQRRLFGELAKTLPVPDLKDKDKSLLDRMKEFLG
jgi:molecular chaperone DnaJ